MAAGGIRDHLGGGFHRYSTDRYWRVPHFEKMLYDNGQLASVYAAAYELDAAADYRQCVDETLAFVQRELTDPQGGFYSSLDAETDGQEGLYYAWQRSEIQQAARARRVRPGQRRYRPGGEAEFRRALRADAGQAAGRVGPKRES